ncbi:DUF4398 domain-containing protein [Pseudomonas sp. MF6768]|jgi:hypothetical protein|uniref:DUF4398 domain-containing protein n=1 Tax=Pseudomonas sp. MF6768 TaxID=2797532 RepID=UPI0018E7E774|nr:DUF4398 domain-containing protein [Pseudomonas sp. MF6768]MBJ2244004.1 DUF4398 domain-containing protein [Pseudomonas sp. MF6768]
MGIKNFTVTTQRVKDKADGLIGYANYLNNEKAPSHKNTKILTIGKNFDDFLKNTIINTMNFDNENKKGGRKVESYAQSFNFILPPDVPNPSIDQWKLIYKDLVLKAKNTLEIKGGTSEFAKSCYANIHDQANPHLNLLIPRIYEKERLHALDQKKLLGELKKEFNKSVLKHCNIDFKSYKPNQQNVGKRRKKWQLEQEQSIKAKEKLADERLELATETLAAAQLIDRSQQVQERAETAQIKAQEATAHARQVEAEADRKISLMEEMKNIFNNFKSSINDWIKGIKDKDELLEDIALNDVVASVKTAQKHESYDETIENLMFNTIEIAEDETKKPQISKKVSRIRKYKP